jgi:uroporphyrinogen decarboxylase
VSVAPPAKPLLETLRGNRQERPPIWIMRQAGRYLPEYRQVRANVGSFLELCYTPALAAEATLQPLRRFNLDAAILFSDILVIPDALGRRVAFESGEGPQLEPLSPEAAMALEAGDVVGRLSPVLEALDRVKSELAPDRTMIGFCGAPWTVATYMIAGRGSPDQAAARLFALNHPDAFARLIDVLIEASAAYLVAQLQGGADVVQIFESWAANLDEAAFRAWVIEPNRRLVEAVRRQVPSAVITGFPRGAGPMLLDYVRGTGVSAVGLDTTVPLAWANDKLISELPVQGNLDPLRLVAGGSAMEERTRDIIAALATRPHVFNLGHGIVPETPIAHVERLIEIVKQG